MASPLVRLHYSSQWVDGYSETGPSASNAVVGSRMVAIGGVSVEIAVNRQTEKRSKILRVGYFYNATFGDDAVNVTMLGQTRNVATFARDCGAGYVRANTSLRLAEMLDSEIGGKATVGRDFTCLQGNLRLVARF